VSPHLALLGGAGAGMVAGALLLPLTRRELAAALSRSSARNGPSPVPAPAPATQQPPEARWHRTALVAASGLLPAYVLFRVGWSIIALPPLMLLLGLIQLAYCDFINRLLPKTLIYAITAPVVVSGTIIAEVTNECERLLMATLGGLGFFFVLLLMNLANPRWMAFGDVRLSPVVGFGLAWVSPVALLEGFFVANLLAAVVGLTLIAAHRADRTSALPFGLYLALGAGIIIVAWS
jgi:leader peptidase (prepilin peptidase)/N-methyltransferase